MFKLKTRTHYLFSNKVNRSIFCLKHMFLNIPALNSISGFFFNHLSLLKIIIKSCTIPSEVVLISIKLLCIVYILEYLTFQKKTYPFSWEGFYHRSKCFLPTIRSLPDEHLLIHSSPKNMDICISNATCFY